jgi:hypothetical protein
MLKNFCVLRLHITPCDVELLDLNVSELVFGWDGFNGPSITLASPVRLPQAVQSHPANILL